MASPNLFLSLFLIVLLGYQGTNAQQTFTNPIIDGNSADPAVLRVGDFYYLVLSTNVEHEITVYKSARLTDFRNTETKVAFVAPEGCSDIWASEMHEVDGELYIYFAMNCGEHKMYAIKADDPMDPMSNWGPHIDVLRNFFYNGIDGSILNHGNGERYFAWASNLELWIAKMINATTLEDSFVRLRTATSGWECSAGCVNEGPFFIYNRGVSYMIFSATTTWDWKYCLGMMSIEGHKDPMVPSNWWYGPDEPVFYSSEEESVFTTGHASFTVSPDGTETWMVYHGTVNKTHINGYRIARVEKITWAEDGLPLFPRPHGYNSPQPVPSGQV